jgi:hypothetical protein
VTTRFERTSFTGLFGLPRGAVGLDFELKGMIFSAMEPPIVLTGTCHWPYSISCLLLPVNHIQGIKNRSRPSRVAIAAMNWPDDSATVAERERFLMPGL